ncbi:MAG: hypothetical protein JRM86_03935 [Nitrososphaerota archaeon]|nr:hypothetical protein [Nitrososphaerota archaeon]MDG7020833.1 hypothetical protein [Nitrososphaerota archaeon]
MVKEDSSEAVRLLNLRAYEIFQGYERRAFPLLISEWMDAYGGDVEKMHEEGVTRSFKTKEPLSDILKEVANKVVNQSYPVVSKFETSVAQMRKKEEARPFKRPCSGTAKGRCEASSGWTRQS